jgi:quercetin dioxygenase-like cupin family protein
LVERRLPKPKVAGSRPVVRSLTAVIDPRTIDFSAADPVSHDPGVRDREAEIGGTRWALVEYSPGSGREEWCDTPHAGVVLSGRITYSFEDGREPMQVGAGEAFALPTAPRHRGRNEGEEPARLFLIDALPGG